MEGMFKNIDLSKEINEEFSKYLSVLPWLYFLDFE
jgi:hypothetical protein